MLRENPELVVVLLLAMLLRAAAQIAYWPVLFFNDSWEYLLASSHGLPVLFVPDRPSGYPILLRLLLLPGKELAVVAIVQHLAGIATAVLVYVLALHGGVSRRWAAVTAAIIALDTWSIALEQRIVTESLFTLSLVAAVVLLSGTRRRHVRFLFAGGILIGVAITMRSVGLFAIPGVLLYVLWDLRSLRAAGAALVGIVVVIGAYGALHAHADSGLGIPSGNGWFLYGRVAEFADCTKTPPPQGTAFLCQAKKDPTRKLGADFYVWSPNSPARRRFPEMGSPGSNDNATLGSFAHAVILHQPSDYLRAVGGDVARFFMPGQITASDKRALALPARAGEDVYDDAAVRRLLAPGYKPAAHTPARLLHAISSWLHLPRLLLAAMTLMAIGALTCSLSRCVVLPHRLLIGLLLVVGMGLVGGGAATSEFVLRYLLPPAPFLLLAGVIAAGDLMDARKAAGPPQTRP